MAPTVDRGASAFVEYRRSASNLWAKTIDDRLDFSEGIAPGDKEGKDR